MDGNIGDKAMQWELTAANLGNDETIKEVWDLHYHREDYEYAVDWYKVAADHGNSEAMRMLGEDYYRGNGVAEDMNKAIKWHRKAAEYGNDETQYKLRALGKWRKS